MSKRISPLIILTLSGIAWFKPNTHSTPKLDHYGRNIRIGQQTRPLSMIHLQTAFDEVMGGMVQIGSKRCLHTLAFESQFLGVRVDGYQISFGRRPQAASGAA